MAQAADVIESHAASAVEQPIKAVDVVRAVEQPVKAIDVVRAVDAVDAVVVEDGAILNRERHLRAFQGCDVIGKCRLLVENIGDGCFVSTATEVIEFF